MAEGSGKSGAGRQTPGSLFRLVHPDLPAHCVEKFQKKDCRAVSSSGVDRRRRDPSKSKTDGEKKMRTRSLRFKLVAGGMLAVMIPLLAVGYFATSRASRAVDELARQQVLNLSEDLSGMTQLALQQELKLAAEITTEASFQKNVAAVHKTGRKGASAAVRALDQRLSGIMEAVGGDYESLLLADAGGVIFSDGSGGTYKGVSIADRSYFQKAAQGRALVGAPVASKVTGKPVVPIAAPVHTLDGQFAGALVSVVKTDFLAREITSV
jgi:methyl-accepting chemotaxis protein